jgi:hypothetical protein
MWIIDGGSFTTPATNKSRLSWEKEIEGFDYVAMILGEKCAWISPTLTTGGRSMFFFSLLSSFGLLLQSGER